MEIVAKNLAEINQEEVFYSLQDFLKDLENRGLLQMSEQEKVKVYWQNFDKSEPKNIIEAMYDLRPLGEEETQMLSVFSVLPAENLHYDTLTALLQPENKRQFAKTLSALATKGWIEKTENEEKPHYKVSPVVQEITRHKNQDRLYDDCVKMINFLIEKLDYRAGVGSLVHITYEQGSLYSRFAESILPHFGNTQNTYTLQVCSILYERIGNFNKAKGDLNKALEYFEKRNELGEQLYRLEPNNVDFANGLAISYSKLGSVYTAKGDLNKALEYFEKQTVIFEQLYRLEPNNVDFANGLALSYQWLGWHWEDKMKDNEKAKPYYQESKKILIVLVQNFPDYVAFQNNLQWVENRLRALE
jgi:tetratricopeptide (TPR) repeat protein